MYRYGDGTPFPFEDNFIDIVGAAVDACAAMFGAAAQLEGLRQKAQQAKREADAEGAKLASLERSIEGAVALSQPSQGKDATLVFYCSNPMCSKAPNAARRAQGWGYRNVRVMAAGIRGWLSAALPTESGEALARP